MEINQIVINQRKNLSRRKMFFRFFIRSILQKAKSPPDKPFCNVIYLQSCNSDLSIFKHQKNATIPFISMSLKNLQSNLNASEILDLKIILLILY